MWVWGPCEFDEKLYASSKLTNADWWRGIEENGRKQCSLKINEETYSATMEVLSHCELPLWTEGQEMQH